jgi:RIO-like serine/threonine protein kinase
MNARVALTRSDLERLPRQELGRHSHLKPSVWRVETPSGPVVVKDSRTSRLSTRWLARWLLGRERRVLERLHDVDGVPRVVASVDRDAFAMSLVPGEPLEERSFRERPRALVEQLRVITQQLHARRVFHLDLHQRKNVFVDETGKLYLIDFGAAITLGPVLHFCFGWLLRYVDRYAINKYLARFAPEEMSEDEARAIVRYGRVRKLWPFTRHSKNLEEAARARLR